MSLITKLLRRLGKLCLKVGHTLLSYKGKRGVWVDVGAHLGQKTFRFAQENPSLVVYAFEPNVSVAAQRTGLLPNFVVIPMAVAEQDGCTDFYINSFDAASSLLPFNPERLQNWVSDVQLEVECKTSVPTIRLETFMNQMKISQIDYLKIDAQGADFAVIKSAGNRLKDIQKIELEVAVTATQLYEGAANKVEVVDYLEQAGFVLVNAKKQSYDQEENLTFVRHL